MKCPKCQADNRDNAKYCAECATLLAIKGPKCGSEVQPTAKFCDNCAYDPTEAKTTPSIDYSQPQTYTPKFLAEKILDTRSSIEGEHKVVTVLFADIANYTSISEKVDPEEIHQIMDGCFKVLMDEIHRYEGTIDKFTGDGIMALFGAPVSHEDHAHGGLGNAYYVQGRLDEAVAEYREVLRINPAVS